MDITSDEYKRLAKIVGAVAVKYKYLFSEIPSVGIEDLIQVGMTGCTNGRIRGAVAAHAEFDPEKNGKYKTYIGMRVYSALIDYRRKLNRKPDLDKYSQQVTQVATDTDSSDIGLAAVASIARCRAALLDQNPITIVRHYGPRRWSRSQIIGALVLRRHMNATYRGLLHVLDEDELVRDALMMDCDTSPCAAWLWVCERRWGGDVSQVHNETRNELAEVNG